jgi:hypothetical protein
MVALELHRRSQKTRLLTKECGNVWDTGQHGRRIILTPTMMNEFRVTPGVAGSTEHATDQ